MEIIKKNIWQLFNTLLLVGLIIYFVNYKTTQEKHKNKIVFIDNIKIFSDFNMTNDLTKQNEDKYKGQIKEFDSLVSTIKTMETNLQKLKSISNKKKLAYAKLQKIIVEKDKELKQIQSYVQNDISKKTWKRLNEYITEYGKKYNLDIIMGAQGNGSIMYGKDNVDITDVFLKYANKKYEGN